MAADCKSALFEFGGSNPPLSTINALCECSSMVEQQPSKLNTRVRFPSLAPIGPACGLRGREE